MSPSRPKLTSGETGPTGRVDEGECELTPPSAMVPTPSIRPHSNPASPRPNIPQIRLSCSLALNVLRSFVPWLALNTHRHVILPKPMLQLLPDELFEDGRSVLRILSEQEWRSVWTS